MVECKRILGGAILKALEWCRGRDEVTVFMELYGQVDECLIYSVASPIDGWTGLFDCFYLDAWGVLCWAITSDVIVNEGGREMTRPEDFDGVEFTSLMRLYDVVYDSEMSDLIIPRD